MFVGDTSDSGEKRGSHLRNQFLLAVEFVAEALAKGTIQAAFVSCAANQLVKQSVVIVGRIQTGNVRACVRNR